MVLAMRQQIRRREGEKISSIMPDEADAQSLVLPPRDYSDIVKLGEENVLDQFLEHPLTASLEAITGAFAGGGKGLLVSAGRIAQGLVKGQNYEVLADEIRRLREAGKLPNNLGETKHGLHTWAELMKIIDDDPPDAERLEALKAAFYAVNKINSTDAERNRAYQLWQIAKELKSGDVILLKTMFENIQNLDGTPGNQWHQRAAELSGLGLSELVILSEARLRDLQLTKESGAVGGSIPLMTNLGRQVAQNIRSYQTDLDAASKSAS